MPLLYHEMGHSIDKLQAGIGVDVYLIEGIYSRDKYREFGRLKTKSVYDEWLSRSNASYHTDKEWHEKYVAAWKAERSVALANKPLLLQRVLKDNEPKFTPSQACIDAWYKPGADGNRDESVFFGYHTNPSPDHDWVAIVVPDTTIVHDANCRDERNYKKWLSTAMTLGAYKEYHDRNKIPEAWGSRYNEAVFKDHMPADKIVAYAKLEKSVPVTQAIEAGTITRIKEELSSTLAFATWFESAEDNILIYLNQQSGKYDIRVSFNKEKAQANLEEINSVFASFENFDQLLESGTVLASPHPGAADDSAATGVGGAGGGFWSSVQAFFGMQPDPPEAPTRPSGPESSSGETDKTPTT